MNSTTSLLVVFLIAGWTLLLVPNNMERVVFMVVWSGAANMMAWVPVLSRTVGLSECGR